MQLTIFLSAVLLALVDSDCPKNAIAGPGGKDCFALGRDPEKWDEADTYCAAENGHLAPVNNAFTNGFLAKIARMSKKQLRLGGLYRDGKWTWVDGSNFTYTNWDKAQPPVDSTGLCLSLTTTGKWTTQPCTTPSPFLCRIRPLPQRIHGGATLPTTTPAYTCEGDDYVYIPLTGKCYVASRGGTYGWSETSEDCRGYGGTLASIHSSELAVRLQKLMRFNQRNYTIGLHDPMGIGLWQWTDGTSMDYENWADGEPQPGKQCGAVFNKYGAHEWDPLWHAVDCDDESQAYAYICQTEAEKSG
ncbi:Protein CLEC-51 [Aphelenchoides avenae]|nr:Protein CLEC-51 [Aphelenchus avenae]